MKLSYEAYDRSLDKGSLSIKRKFINIKKHHDNALKPKEVS